MIIGRHSYQQDITNDPTKYFTNEILEKLDKACDKEFKYGDVVEEQIPETTQD